MEKNTKEKTFHERLSEQLSEHRKKLGLTQEKVAELLHISEKTYQRWESKGISNIYDILKLFQLLEFSSAEIIDLFGFPPIKLSDIGENPTDTEQKDINENHICAYINENIIFMKDSTIERLLGILFAERIKRHQSK